MNRDAIKQAAKTIEELEKVETDIADLNREDIALQVALLDKTNGFTRIADVQRPELLAVLNAKRDTLIKGLDRLGVVPPIGAFKPIPAPPPPMTAPTAPPMTGGLRA